MEGSAAPYGHFVNYWATWQAPLGHDHFEYQRYCSSGAAFVAPVAEPGARVPARCSSTAVAALHNAATCSSSIAARMLAGAKRAPRHATTRARRGKHLPSRRCDGPHQAVPPPPGSQTQPEPHQTKARRKNEAEFCPACVAAEHCPRDDRRLRASLFSTGAFSLSAHVRRIPGAVASQQGAWDGRHSYRHKEPLITKIVSTSQRTNIPQVTNIPTYMGPIVGVDVQLCNSRFTDGRFPKPGTIAVSSHKPGIIAVSSHKPGTIAVSSHKPGIIAVSSHKPGTIAVSSHKPGIIAVSSHKPGTIAVSSHKPGTIAVSSHKPGTIAVSSHKPGIIAVSSHKSQIKDSCPVRLTGRLVCVLLFDECRNQTGCCAFQTVLCNTHDFHFVSASYGSSLENVKRIRIKFSGDLLLKNMNQVTYNVLKRLKDQNKSSEMGIQRLISSSYLDIRSFVILFRAVETRDLIYGVIKSLTRKLERRYTCPTKHIISSIVISSSETENLEALAAEASCEGLHVLPPSARTSDTFINNRIAVKSGSGDTLPGQNNTSDLTTRQNITKSHNSGRHTAPPESSHSHKCTRHLHWISCTLSESGSPRKPPATASRHNSTGFIHSGDKPLLGGVVSSSAGELEDCRRRSISEETPGNVCALVRKASNYSQLSQDEIHHCRADEHGEAKRGMNVMGKITTYLHLPTLPRIDVVTLDSETIHDADQRTTVNGQLTKAEKIAMLVNEDKQGWEEDHLRAQLLRWDASPSPPRRPAARIWAGRTRHAGRRLGEVWAWVVLILAVWGTGAGGHTRPLPHASTGCAVNGTSPIPDKNCGSFHLRNDPSSLAQLCPCVRVVGRLHLSLMKGDVNASRVLQGFSFPYLREITEYLLLYRVPGLASLATLFPNLAVIRGTSLFHNYALVIYSLPDLKEVGLPSLTAILRGSVRIERNPSLCFVHTVDWDGITRFSMGSNVVKRNRLKEECPSCPDRCGGADRCEEPRCWGPQHCQMSE
ncbi:uncharacterized protein [Procambarus clarkii]|uniref:uncharacterized protein n=1 Tax=Procambarus clarkii TaxID=6728 RepID=UPI0037430E4F